MRPRDDIKKTIYDAFRRAFPDDALVDISDGYQENIHVMVVSRSFDGMAEREKQDWLWSILDSTELTDEEKGLVSLLYPVSPAEIK